MPSLSNRLKSWQYEAALIELRNPQLTPGQALKLALRSLDTRVFMVTEKMPLYEMCDYVFDAWGGEMIATSVLES